MRESNNLGTLLGELWKSTGGMHLVRPHSIARPLVCATIVALSGTAGAAYQAGQNEQAAEDDSLEDPAVDHAQRRLDAACSARESGDFEAARAISSQAVDALLAEDHPENAARLLLLLQLAAFSRQVGDLLSAERTLRYAVDASSGRLGDDHPEVQRIRGRLAEIYLLQRRPDEARDVLERAVERLSTGSSSHDTLTQVLRLSLGSACYELGDLDRSREHLQKALRSLGETLPDDDRTLQIGRQRLALTAKAMGDLHQAYTLEEKVLEILTRTLPNDDLTLQSARTNLAVTVGDLGDPHRARALEEKVVEVFAAKLPEDHPHRWMSQSNLAARLSEIGDLPRARAMLEKLVQSLSRTMGGAHLDLQAARLNLAIVMKEQGDLDGARTLEEKVLEVRSSLLADDHPHLQMIRMNLGVTLDLLGEHDLALELKEKVLAVRAETLPDDHLHLQVARQALAVTLKSLGDHARARRLEEEVLSARSAVLPEDHEGMLGARANLAFTIAAQQALAGEEESAGERERFVGISDAYLRALTRAARSTLLDVSAREAEERCSGLFASHGPALSIAHGLGVFPTDEELVRLAFVLSETTRGAALASAYLSRLTDRDDRWDELRGELSTARAELARVAAGVPDPDALDVAIARRDAAERGLVRRAVESTDGAERFVEFDLSALEGALSINEAAIAYRRHTWVDRRPGSAALVEYESLCAFVVRPGQELACVDLGPIRAIEEAVSAWRSALGVSAERGFVLSARTGDADHAQATGDTLRRLVLDPLFPRLARAERLIVVSDDVLNIIPIDALPMASARSAPLVGERYAIGQRRTLYELLLPRRPRKERDVLVAVGAPAFDGLQLPLADTGSKGAASSGTGLSPQAAPLLRGGGWKVGFDELEHTGPEVHGIASLFGDSHGGEASAVILEGLEACRAGVEEHSPKARWLHLATHGWFAPESVRSWKDPAPLDARSGFGVRTGGQERVTGSSPMVLCGIALAGANLGTDAVGRRPGLVTAEEIAAWDLRDCELAVISACSTNVGERRAGQGVASLQKALHIAGARSVITSLWGVPDEATRALMLDFYRRIWVVGQPKSEALWAAKMTLRDARDARGRSVYSTGAWAAWVLTGEPD